MQGDLASLRVILGLAVIWIIFQSQNDRFLTAVNLTNLMLQITAVGLISVGVVYVLLLGEIDLSVGAVSGLAAAVMAVLNVKHGWDPYLAIAAGVAVRDGDRVAPGRALHPLRHPVVRGHAGRAARPGRARCSMCSATPGRSTSPTRKITGLANTFYSDAVGWIMAAGRDRRLRRGDAVGAGGSAWPPASTDRQLTGPLIRIVVVAAAVIAAVAVLNSDRGVPLAVLILVGFVVGMEYVAKRTRFGRHVFAVGGNAEAARRAGISVHTIRVDRVRDRRGSMAAIGGIMRRLAAAGREPGLRRQRPAAARDRGPGDRRAPACSAAAARSGRRCSARS